MDDTPTSIVARHPASIEPAGDAGRYGLMEPPFSTAPAGRFVYPSRSYSIACGQLGEALRRGEGLVVLIGESGTGKTTLCRAVLQTVTAPLCLSVIVDPLLTAKDLLRQILHDFRTSADGAKKKATNARLSRYDLMMALRRFLLSMPHDARAVVVIDDAHHLEPSMLPQLRALANLETDTAKLIQIVLVGQPALETLLDHPDARELGQRVSRLCRLEPLSPSEVAAYVDYRLSVAQGAPMVSHADEFLALPEPLPDPFGNVRFMPRAIQTLAAVSGGVPRTVNLVCDRALEQALARETPVISREFVLEAVAGLQMPVPIGERVSRTGVLALAAATLFLVVATLIWIERPAKTSQVAVSPRAAVPISPVALASKPPMAPAVTPAVVESAAVTGTLSSADAYLVMAGSIPDAQRAAELSRKFLDLGLPAFVRSGPDGRWHALVVGPYASMAEAQDAQQRVLGRDFPEPEIRIEKR